MQQGGDIRTYLNKPLRNTGLKSLSIGLIGYVRIPLILSICQFKPGTIHTDLP